MGDPKTKFYKNVYYGFKIFDTDCIPERCFCRRLFFTIYEDDKKACKTTQHAERQQKSMQNYSACMSMLLLSSAYFLAHLSRRLRGELLVYQ